MDNFHGIKQLAPSKFSFSVFAPDKKSVTLHLIDIEKKISLKKNETGYFTGEAEVKSGARYKYIIDDGNEFPDPASQFQPEGVHGPSQIIEHKSFKWTDNNWRGLAFNDLVIYELHVGTFTPEGTFEAIIPRLQALFDTGINAIEIMPISQFPGKRNWGYDGVFPYAVQNSYGGPEGLKKLIDACHQIGISVILDVVYNHIGPEGNYLGQFAPYFNDNYHTPWGDAINFDNAWSDGIREYFLQNALYWLEHFHFDGLRLDAIHAIYDPGSRHFLSEISREVRNLSIRYGRQMHMIAESDLNDPKVLNDSAVGGYGFTAQWLDDFHHALYTLIDVKGQSRYYDFGSIIQLAKAYKDGFVHTGEFVKFRKRKYGMSSAGIDGNRFVAFILNHDQIGNRPDGARICMLVDLNRTLLAAAALLLSPYIPMLFMGEEYGDRTPFYYFVDHSDPKLIEAVRKGRAEEFKEYGSEMHLTDPADERTFTDSVLKWSNRKMGEHKIILEWHTQLLTLRRTHPALKNLKKDDVQVSVLNDSAISIYRRDSSGKNPIVIFLNFKDDVSEVQLPSTRKIWKKILDVHDHISNIQSDEKRNGGEQFKMSGAGVCVFSALE
jgi:maltooligosyltrehalose trehalohydrolase